MITSEIEICNMALAHLGIEYINSFDEETKVEFVLESIDNALMFLVWKLIFVLVCSLNKTIPANTGIVTDAITLNRSDFFISYYRS